MGVAQAFGRVGSIRRSRIRRLLRRPSNGRRRRGIRLSESRHVSGLCADGFSRICCWQPRHLRNRIQRWRRIIAQAHPTRALRTNSWNVRASSLLESHVPRHVAAPDSIQAICVGGGGFGNEAYSFSAGNFLGKVSAFLSAGIVKPEIWTGLCASHQRDIPATLLLASLLSGIRSDILAL